MGGFLWTTTAGLIDFLFFSAVCGWRLLVGPVQARMCAAVLVIAFLLNRVALAFLDGPGFALAITSIALAAIIWTFALTEGERSLSSRAIIGLWIVQMTIFTTLICGFITFETMAASVTVTAYAQWLILLFAGPVNGVPVYSRRFGVALRGGGDGVEARREAVRYSRSVERRDETSEGFVEEAR